jgi:hypothetical protein
VFQGVLRYIDTGKTPQADFSEYRGQLSDIVSNGIAHGSSAHAYDIGAELFRNQAKLLALFEGQAMRDLLLQLSWQVKKAEVLVCIASAGRFHLSKSRTRRAD